ncbi:MAG TPA: hypothetical protein PKO36_03125 [Candidatus Hydrogenedentes bacterium]|nr:hypothetical protein [Candidatus Hydrogenedentota bacterium]HPC16733.1 hypothetical protein [Candidatus Hydrogenedentota bacterium]HRT21368.1 hypothetical protein [Candidatus Hydrogenedentota bacterium]HRT65913.1 hypothetical protein [Candidatus Hydrogenedentota bacterium]
MIHTIRTAHKAASRQDAIGLMLAAALMLILFSTAASAAIALLAWKGAETIAPGAAWARTALFGGMAAVAAWGVLVRARHSASRPIAEASSVSTRKTDWRLLPAALLAGAIVAFPRLDAYPWIAPDEAHHMGVARNVAAYHVYGSGLPETGFRWFDAYDSVGAPVIAPVAAAMALAGSDPAGPKTIAWARAAMALYFGLLCALAYATLAPFFGAGTALAGVVMMLAMPGSAYLARTLYGEAPALAWLLAGLIIWSRPGNIAPGLAAGVCFGMAVLCKTIVMLAVFPFFGVLCFEYMTGRRARLSEWTMPAIGGMAVVGAWWAAQTLLRHDVAGAAGGMLGEYQHNLIFGLRCLARTLPALWREPFTWYTALAGLAFAAWTLSARRYNRSTAVLFMIAVFYLYWWLFFTPGHIHRYLWFSQAVGGLFGGVAAWQAYRAIGPATRFRRIVLAIFVVSVAAAPGARLASTMATIWTADEMRGYYEVASAVRNLPKCAAVCTADKPLAWILCLLAQRQAEVVEHVPAERLPRKWLIVREDRTFRLLPPAETPNGPWSARRGP